MEHRDVYTVELYERVRRAVIVEGMSEREAAREFGWRSRQCAIPCRRGINGRSRCGGPSWMPGRDHQSDPGAGQEATAQAAHTAKRIIDRLKTEPGYSGGYTNVKDYVRLRKLRQREMSIPLEHLLGNTRADFGEAQVMIAGVERKAHYRVVDLP